MWLGVTGSGLSHKRRLRSPAYSSSSPSSSPPESSSLGQGTSLSGPSDLGQGSLPSVQGGPASGPVAQGVSEPAPPVSRRAKAKAAAQIKRKKYAAVADFDEEEVPPRSPTPGQMQQVV